MSLKKDTALTLAKRILNNDSPGSHAKILGFMLKNSKTTSFYCKKEKINVSFNPETTEVSVTGKGKIFSAFLGKESDN